ncbi:sugar transporter [Dissophora ornata]|nr:sugar transporter [Dissophora ornata]
MPLLHRRSSALKHRLSILDVARLTVCMLGVQFTWTVELGYGTPYLLSLGIPKSLTPLVWLAGPLSGLVIQPIVGVFSDGLDWKLGRRRPFILIGAVLTAISMYTVAYARELAMAIVTQGREEDKDAYESMVKGWTIGFAVVGFYSLDFSINAVQASCRSLIMDIPETSQQEECNAWSGWMNNLGSVVGFFAGNLDLVKFFSPWLGDSQIKILANLAMVCFVVALAITCLSVKEVQYVPTEEDKKRSAWSTLGNIWKVFRKLPAEIQRICNVQFFAWMGWFPFLFYSTSWVGEILHRYDNDNDNNYNSQSIYIMTSSSSPPPDDNTAAERAGSFALLCWAGVAVVCGILIPKITPQEIGIERWPRNPFTLKNLWTMSMVWFAVCMGMTWFVDDLWAATGVIALCGVPWAVAMWIPFAMVGEIIKSSITTATVPNQDGGEDDNDDDSDACSLIVGHGLTDSELEAERKNRGAHLDAGLVLGVHNLYIVFPQFADAIIASCMFAMIGSTVLLGDPEPVGWVLRFGGLMALVGAYLSRRL